MVFVNAEMMCVASGLQFLRSQNVVHRDLKPANLLLSSKNLATAKLKIGAFVRLCNMMEAQCLNT